MKSVLRLSKYLFFFLVTLLLTKAQAQYCSPTYFQGCVFGNEINDFHITGALGTSINDVATGCSSTSGGIGGGYDNRTGESVTLYQGTSYTLTVSDGTVIATPADGFQV